jgi:putative membrane protein
MFPLLLYTAGADMPYLVLMKYGLIQPAIASGITTNITQLQETLSHLERICNTPLPFAYQAHLRMSLWYVLQFASRIRY